MNKSEITLTDDQRTALSELKEFRRKSMSDYKTNKVFILSGWAGTGKTTVTARFVNDNPYGIMVCAPTHEAKSVIMSKITASVDFETVQAALGLRERINNDGSIDFIPSKYNKLKHTSLVIVDEASMVSSKLLTYLMSVTSRMGIPVVFVGDPSQIPPIGESLSPVFSQKFAIKHAARLFCLTKIVRQADGNPIIRASAKIRESSLIPTYSGIKCALAACEFDGKGVYHICSHDVFLDKFNIADHGVGSAKILTFTNSCVNYYNAIVREYINPDSSKNIVSEGDMIILKEPLVDGDSVLLPVNTKAIVTKVGYSSIEINSIDFEILEIKISVDGFYEDFTIRTPMGDSAVKFEKMLNSMAAEIKRSHADRYSTNDEWVRFYRIKRIFTDWQHGYAMTTHRSQGSTFKHVLIDMRDMWRINDAATRNRLIYTAVTRASESVSIIW